MSLYNSDFRFFEKANELWVLIARASSEGSGDTVQTHILDRGSNARPQKAGMNSRDKGPAHALIQEFSSGVGRVLTIKSLTTFFSVLICFTFYVGVRSSIAKATSCIIKQSE